MQIPWADGLVMSPGMVFALIIGKIFLSRVPVTNIVGILCYLVTNPKISHFHRLRTLAFDSVVRDTDGRGVVAMDRGFWLGVPQFLKCEAEDHALFAIEEEGTEFGFRC